MYDYATAIKTRRILKGWGRQTLADFCVCDPGDVRKWESGKMIPYGWQVEIMNEFMGLDMPMPKEARPTQMPLPVRKVGDGTDTDSPGGMIRRARMEKGYTQERLARMLGVTRATLQTWEAGSYYPATRNIPKINACLGLNLSKEQRCIGTKYRTPLAAARVKLGLSQKQVGEMIGVSEITVNYWEAGRYAPRKEYYDKIREVYGIESW